MKKDVFIKYAVPEVMISDDFIVITYEEIREETYNRTLNGFIWLDNTTPEHPETVTLNCREHKDYGPDFHCDCYEKGHEEVTETPMALEDFVLELYKAGVVFNDIPNNLFERSCYEPNQPFWEADHWVEKFYKHSLTLGIDPIPILQQRFPYVHFKKAEGYKLYDSEAAKQELTCEDRPTVLYQDYTFVILKFKDFEHSEYNKDFNS